MNGTMDESMDTSSSEMPYSSIALKSPQSNSNALNNHADSSNNTDSSVTENGHYQAENSQNSDKMSNLNSFQSNQQNEECTPMEVDQNDDSASVQKQIENSKNNSQVGNKRTNSLDPLAESSSDSFQNANANIRDKTNTVHSTTNLGETENSNDSRTSNSNMDERRQNINNCPNSNDSAANSDSVDSSHLKHKSETGSDDESGEIHEIQSDSENDQVKTVTVNDEDTDEELDSEEDSSDEDLSDGSEVGVEDGTSGPEEGPVSIHSDSEPEAIGDDSSKDSQNRNTNKSSEVLLVDDASNQGDEKHDKNSQNNKPSSPVIHEITSDNDDCIVTDEKMGDDDKKDLDSSIRRSSRISDKQTFKSQKYGYDHDDDDDDDESDIEEVLTDPLNQNLKNKNAIVINNTKKLADLAMKQNGKPGINVPGQKKEPTVVIIDTNSILTTKTQVPVPPKVPFSSLPPQTLYESMAARGTTVTPLSAKPLPTQPAAPPAPSPAVILPSLTDDMFVVEAPSFIVPYVYEKPSLKPFREFVDILGKELDEQIKKEEQDRLEKEREYREKMGLNKKEPEVTATIVEKVHSKSKDKSMEVDDELQTLDSKKGSSKRNRKKKKEDDDASWDGESTSDSDDEGLSDDDRPKTIIIKEKDDDSLDAIKDPMITDLTTDSKNAPKTNSYFDNSLGKFFINIGMNLVQEFVQSDLLKQQKRKLQRENRMGSGNVKATETAISSLLKNLEFSKENNAPYKFQHKKCEFCSFKTESALTMAHHMETPHMKNGIYKCNFCPFEVRSPHDILFHMEAEHNTRGRLERAPSYHQCPNCPFEDNGKGKLGRHLISCAKKFKPEHNLIPPIEWEPPAKIPKATHARHSMMNSYQNVFAKMQTNTQITPGMLPQVVRGRGRPPILPNLKPVQTPLVRGGVLFKQSTAQQVLLPNYQVLPVNLSNAQAASLQLPKVLQHQPSISITPLPRTTQSSVTVPTPSQAAAAASLAQNKSTFVICEICDGYIKDLEQLRNHMQWIHKVKIHPKMIYNRPPLNCQKCQFRFFTDQGLERHLLGSHGLVTSSMQEAANKGKDAGRCPICGRVYQWKLLNHVARDHNMVLKPAHLSYKCTVCTATFGMYRQFENHVYSAHSVVAKRGTDKNKGSTASAPSSSKVTLTSGGSLLKPVNSA